MKKIIWIVVALVVILAVGFEIYKFNSAKDIMDKGCSSTETRICLDGTIVHRVSPYCDFPCPVATSTPKKVSVQNVNIKVGDTVESPLQLNGEARNWYFEASFPVKMYDANGKLLGSVPAQAQSDWTTGNFVPFKALLYFATSTTDSGVIILEKDNPSGLPANADQFEIPIRFKK